MKALFETIIRTNPQLQGWCSLEKAITLASLIVGYRPEISFEGGVFGGRSLLPMALAHKAINLGKVIGVDAWDKGVAVDAQPTNEDKEWWRNVNMEQIYDGCMAAIHSNGVSNFCQVIRNKTQNVECPWGVGLLHIDGGHDQTAITDTIRFAPRVKAGGFVVMDDIGMFGNSTTIAAQRLVQMGFSKLYNIDTGAVFQRTK